MQVATESQDGGNDFGDMEIDRGGAMIGYAPAASGSSSGPASVRIATTASAPGRGSGLEVAYRRSDLESAPVDEGPSVLEKALANGIAVVVSIGVVALLVKVAHRHGGRNIMTLLPHAFDATSLPQSGALGLVAFVLAIGVGFAGVKVNARSYAMVGSAVMFVVASLAMITVALVATEENPTPADGALLIPYAIPLGILLLGIGLAGRAVRLFYRGGVHRASTLLVAAFGGALVFAALELSALSSRLP